MTGPYKIGTLSRLTGFSPALLRTWERRHGLLEPERGPGGHRLYTDDDLRVLQRVRALVDQGRSIGEIARPGRAALLVESGAPTTLDTVEASGTTEATGAWRRRLIDAALALDAATLSATLDDVFAALAPERAIRDIIEPVALEVGRLWEAGRCSVASEHLISDEFLHRVRGLLAAGQPTAAPGATVLAACFPDEQHQLGLAILGCHLTHRDVRVAYLGPAVPLADLARAAAAARPRALLLSVTRRPVFETHYRALVEMTSDGAFGAPVFVGGQGVPEDLSTRADDRLDFVVDTPLDDVVRRVLAVAVPGRSRARGKPRGAR